MEFSQEEVNNLLVLLDAGARSLAAQNKLDKAAGILGAADALSKKVAELTKKDEEASS